MRAFLIMQPLVSFLSDFGLADTYVAQVKARIIDGCPEARIIDLTHLVAPGDLVNAGWQLHAACRHFPAGTVHLAVVDPGVGTERKALIVEKGGHLFVGPDNGLFSFIYPADTVINVRWRPGAPLSNTFHGRDLFAPLVVRLLQGAAPQQLGAPLENPVRFDTSRPLAVHVDRFGNIITNMDHEMVTAGIRVGRTLVSRHVETFAQLDEGETGWLMGSAGTVEIVANRDSAARLLGVRPGDELFLA